MSCGKQCRDGKRGRRTPVGRGGASDRRVVACRELSVGRPDLPARQPAARGAARPEHIKPRLLGQWGTTPGLNFIYAHLNRVIRARDLSVLSVIGPGHGGPAMVANTWLEGSYSELYAKVPRTAEGMKRLFRQFSFPGGIPSHCAPESPGPSTRAASSVIRSPMPSGRLSTTRSCSCPVWSAMAKPRPGRSRPPGIPTSF